MEEIVQTALMAGRLSSEHRVESPIHRPDADRLLFHLFFLMLYCVSASAQSDGMFHPLYNGVNKCLSWALDIPQA